MSSPTAPESGAKEAAPPYTPKPRTSKPDQARDEEDVPQFESCHCPIIIIETDVGSEPEHDDDTNSNSFNAIASALPLNSRIPTPQDPLLPGQCIYHHRLSTREEETAIFIQLAPEIDELKEVLTSGMVKFRQGSDDDDDDVDPQQQRRDGKAGRSSKVSGPVIADGSSIVLRKPATDTQLSEASSGLKLLIAERDRMVGELWARFVGRWGGRVERRDDGTMFVVGVGAGDADGDGNKGAAAGGGKGGDDGDDENDPYVSRMRQVRESMGKLDV